MGNDKTAAPAAAPTVERIMRLADEYAAELQCAGYDCDAKAAAAVDAARAALAAALTEIIAAAPAAAPAEQSEPSNKFAPGDEVRHRKGGTYKVLGRCVIEATGQDCYFYRGADGRVWVRPVGEMEDGRFTLLSSAAQGEPSAAPAAAPADMTPVGVVAETDTEWGRATVAELHVESLPAGTVLYAAAPAADVQPQPTRDNASAALLDAAKRMLRAYETGLTAQFPHQLDAADALRAAIAAAMRSRKPQPEQQGEPSADLALLIRAVQA